MAFANRQELVDRGIDLIQNEGPGIGIDRAIIEDEADATVAWLSRFLQRRATATANGTGSKTRFTFTTDWTFSGTPTPAWTAGFSSVLWVEHPTGDLPRTFLDDAEFWLYPDRETATALEFQTAPASGSANVQIGLTAMHSVTDAASSFTDEQEPGVEYALAARCCLIYASSYGHTTRPALDQDAIDYGGLPATWRALSEAFLAEASQVLGVTLSLEAGGAAGGGAGNPTVGAMHEWDPSPSLLHRPRRLG